MAERNPVVYVTVDGATYPAGKTLPDGVAESIDNPKVWGEQSVEDEAPKPAKKAAAKRSTSK